MSITQVIALVPVASANVARLRSREKHAGSRGTEVPPTTTMPGTKEHLGLVAVHFVTRVPPAEIEDSLPVEWDTIAAQDFFSSDAYIPVPDSFVDWMDDSVSPPAPGDPLHKFFGAVDWSWEQVVNE